MLHYGKCRIYYIWRLTKMWDPYVGNLSFCCFNFDHSFKICLLRGLQLYGSPMFIPCTASYMPAFCNIPYWRLTIMIQKNTIFSLYICCAACSGESDILRWSLIRLMHEVRKESGRTNMHTGWRRVWDREGERDKEWQQRERDSRQGGFILHRETPFTL